MSEGEGWFFPELTPSYKVIFFMQLLACYILVVVVGLYLESWLWGAVAFAVNTLKDCFVVTAMIQASRAAAISEETQRRMVERQSSFNSLEGRLLDRSTMDVPRTPIRYEGTVPMAPDEYGQ